MRYPSPSSGGAVLTVMAMLVSGCAAHQPSGLAAKLVRGGDGPGGLAWPAVPTGDAASGLGEQPAAQAAPAASFRAKYQARQAAELELSDAGLRSALEAAGPVPTVESLHHVAAAYKRLRVFDRTLSYLEQALALDPKDARTRDALARLWRDWGVPARGLAEAYRAVALSPDSPAAQNTLAILLYDVGEPTGADARFERVLALDPGAAYALSNMCYAALMGGDWTRALGRCQAALAVDPDFAAARNNLGLVYAAAGRWDDAAREFLAGAPDAAAGRYNLGVALLSRQQYLAAADAFDAAAALKPELARARDRARQARRLAAAAAADGGR